MTIGVILLRRNNPSRPATALGAAILTAVLTVSIIGLAACAGTGAEPSAPATARKTVRIGIAYDIGGRGDKTFNDAVAAGMERAKTDLDVQTQELEAQKGEGDDERYARLKVLCDAGYDLIIAVGFLYAGDPKAGPLARAVRDCPKAKFAIVDDDSVSAPNLANLVFAEEQGSFLVGAAAALRSRTGRIGFIAGCDVKVLRRFQAGYQAGARAIRATITIKIDYLSTADDNCSGFNDPAKGKLVATGMYRDGVDIVFSAAGASGNGVFAAAKAANRWAIGVDSDQYRTVSSDLREVIITSMVKRVDVAVFDLVKRVANGTFQAGVTTFDLSADGVGYSTSGGKIDDLVPQLEKLKKEIIDGKIRVPETP